MARCGEGKTLRIAICESIIGIHGQSQGLFAIPTIVGP